MTARVIAFANPAGSSAKSTVTAALADLASASKRVLAIDLDPQANLTGWLAASRDNASITAALQTVVSNRPEAWPGVPVAEILADRHRQVSRTIQVSPTCPASIIAADPKLRSMISRWLDLCAQMDGPLVPAVVETVADDFDLILLDCKGDLAGPAEEAVGCADQVIGVAEPTTKSLQGLRLLAAETVARNPDGVFAAVIPAKVLPRSHGAAADDLYTLMRETYPDRTTSPFRQSKVVEAAYAEGAPITRTDPCSRPAEDLRRIFAELTGMGVL